MEEDEWSDIVREHNHRQGLRELLQTILSRGDKRKWDLVRSAIFMPKSGSIQAVITMLDYIRLKLERLVFKGDEEEGVSPPFTESLDFHYRISSIKFLALTHLIVGEVSIRCPDFGLFLLASSPNLAELRVNLNGCQL